MTGASTRGVEAELYEPRHEAWRDVGIPRDAARRPRPDARRPEGPVVQVDPRTLAVYDRGAGWVRLPEMAPAPVVERSMANLSGKEGPELSSVRHKASITRLDDGSILVAGGVDDDNCARQTSLRLERLGERCRRRLVWLNDYRLQ